jgi:hypothetical protein
MANELRVRGQETFVVVVENGVPTDAFGALANIEISFEHTQLREGFLGETSDRTDSIFDAITLSMEFQLQNPADIDILESLVRRAQRRAGGTASLAISTIYVFPNGEERQLVFRDVAAGTSSISSGARNEYVTASLEAEAPDFLLIAA